MAWASHEGKWIPCLKTREKSDMTDMWGMKGDKRGGGARELICSQTEKDLVENV